MKPDATYGTDFHRYNYAEIDVEVMLDHFHEDRKEGLIAEVTVSCGRQPKPGILHYARLNLSSSTSKQTYSRALEKRISTEYLSDVDFTGIIEQVCILSVKRWRDGDPIVDLREIDTTDRPRWLLEPYVQTSGTTVMFADGGSGKSVMCLAMAASIASGHAIIGAVRESPRPVLYLDWEDDEYTHSERLKALCRGAGISVPPVFYRRQVGSLAESAAALRKEITGLGIGCVIVDSMGMARGGEPESADVTIRLFQAARSLGLPVVAVDHLAKGADGSKPFGSVYTHNLARVSWHLEKAAHEGAGEMVVALTNKKVNRGHLAHREAYRLCFEGDGDEIDRITIVRTDMRDVPEFAKNVPLRQRIERELASGRKTVAELAELLDEKEATVRARLADLAKWKKVQRQGAAWGLLYVE